jgi:hypothetical protein
VKPITLDDVNRLFLPLPEHPQDSRIVRGVLLAVAQDWAVRLPDRPQKAAAIGRLVDAADLACEAIASA